MHGKRRHYARASQNPPIDIGPQLLAAHRAQRFALNVDAGLGTYLLPDRDSLAEVTDGRFAPPRETIAGIRIKCVEVCKKWVHASILPFSNGNAIPFGVLPISNWAAK